MQNNTASEPQSDAAKVRQAVNRILGAILKGERLKPEVEKLVFTHPEAKRLFVFGIRSLFMKGNLKPSSYLDRLMFKFDFELLVVKGKENAEKVGDVLPMIVSTSAICVFLLRNDTSAPDDIVGRTIAMAKANSKVFESIIVAANKNGQKKRQILALYFLYYVERAKAIRGEIPGSNGFLPTNSYLINKIPVEDFELITEKLYPEDVEKDPQRLTHHVFDKFIYMIAKKDLFGADQRWRDIYGKISRFLAKYLKENVEGLRLFPERDASLVREFDEPTVIKDFDGKPKLVRNNPLRDKLAELMDYRPILAGKDAYVDIKTALEPEGTSVILLNEDVEVEVMNPQFLRNKGEAMTDLRFVLKVFVDIRVGKRFDHTTLLREGEIRIKAKEIEDEDGKVIGYQVIFNTSFDAKVPEPSLGEITVEVFSANNERIDTLKADVIILPEGSAALVINDRIFARKVKERMVDRGRLSIREYEAAIVNLPDESIENSNPVFILD